MTHYAPSPALNLDGLEPELRSRFFRVAPARGALSNRIEHRDYSPTRSRQQPFARPADYADEPPSSRTNTSPRIRLYGSDTCGMVNPRPLSPMANWRLPGVSAYREDVSHVLRPAIQMPALPKRAFHVSDDRREQIAARPQYRRSGDQITYSGNLLANCREYAGSLPGIFRRLARPILAAKRPPPQSFPCESRQTHGTKPARSRQKAGHLPAS